MMETKRVWDPGEVKENSKIIALLKLIRIEHTLFSLPFAYIGALALKEIPTLREVILIAIALFGLRAASMSFNNIADYNIDKYNPRTANRPLIRGDVSFLDAWLVVFLGLILYFTSSALLNWVALILSPIPLIIVLTYPYAKRIHCYPHIHLGFSLGIVPVAGYIAVVGDHFDVAVTLLTAPWFLTLAIVFWVAGFDTIYALMDLEFDKEYGVKSVPVKFGEKGAVKLSRLFHAIFLFFLTVSWYLYKLSLGSMGAIFLIAVIIIYGHLKLNIENGTTIRNFLNINLLVGILLLIGITVDILV